MVSCSQSTGSETDDRSENCGLTVKEVAKQDVEDIRKETVHFDSPNLHVYSEGTKELQVVEKFSLSDFRRVQIVVAKVASKDSIHYFRMDPGLLRAQEEFWSGFQYFQTHGRLPDSFGQPRHQTATEDYEPQRAHPAQTSDEDLEWAQDQDPFNQTQPGTETVDDKPQPVQAFWNPLVDYDWDFTRDATT